MGYTYGFIGAGNMATAIVTGMVQSGLCNGSDIILSNRSPEKPRALQERFGVAVAASNAEVFATADYVILAIKPQQLEQVASEVGRRNNPRQMIISILAGTNIQTIAQYFGAGAIARVMPNTPALIGWGMTGMSANDSVTVAQKRTVEAIFQAVGKATWFAEKELDAVGAVSGCGPAFCYQILEAMADGGVMIGLSRGMAYQLAAQTMAGSALMYLETGKLPAELKDQVTSPGGTTICGLKAMEDRGVRGAMMEAVQQAYFKSKELGKQT